MGKSVEEIRAELAEAEAAEAAAAEEALTAAEDATPATIQGFTVTYSDGTVVQFNPVEGSVVTVPVDEPAPTPESPEVTTEDSPEKPQTTEDLNTGADATVQGAAQ